MAKPIRVVSVGPGLTVQGGMSRVIELILARLPQGIEVRHVATFTRYTGDRETAAAARGSRTGQALVYIGALATILRLALERKAIFHVHFAGRGSLLRKGVICIALRSLRCRYLVHSHAAGTELFHSWVPAPCRRMLLWGLQGADRVIVLTRFWYDYYRPLLHSSASRLVLLPNPANLPAVIPERKPGALLRLLFLGRVGKRKGAFDLIRAFASLPKEIRSSCHLTLAGDGETDAAQALVTELQCSEQISVPGWVGQKEVDQLLGASDVLVLPSHAEGMAMALLEGMSWGLAVVTTSAGGTEDFLENGKNCLLVTPGSVPEISHALEKLVRNPKWALRLGHAARQTMTRYSIEKYISRLTKLYEELAYGFPLDSVVEGAIGAAFRQTPDSYAFAPSAPDPVKLEASSGP